MDGTIAVIVAILMVIAHIIKSIKEGAEAAKQPPPDAEQDELVIIPRPKPVKQPRENRSRSLARQPLEDDPYVSTPVKRQALSKKLSPQGEGHRFEADPGSLDAARIVAPTIDPTVKPELESITGIYEEGASFSDRSTPAITLNLADYLAKPEGVIQAVILAEIMNRPAWKETTRQQI